MKKFETKTSGKPSAKNMLWGNSLIKKVIAVFSFLTVIPVTRSVVSLRDMVDGAYLFPLIGGFIGFVGGLIAYVAGGYSVGLLGGFAALGVLVFITGAQHADGLLDFGDAVMHHAPRKERVKVMRDSRVGAGGFLVGFFLYTITALAIANINRSEVIGTLIVAEMVSKNGILFAAFMGNPATRGTGSFFIANLKGRRGFINVLVASILSLVLSTLLLGWIGALYLLLSLAVSVSINQLSKRLLAGLTGDVLGAVNEITRGTVLLVGLWC